MFDATSVDVLVDEQSVLLWQACAYAEDLIDATNSKRDPGPARDALLRFIHYNVYPYLRFEEVEVSDWARPDGRLSHLQVADHDRIRLAADTIEISRTRADLALAVPSLVDRLSRHIQRGQTWVTDSELAVRKPRLDVGGWTPPLLTDRVDVDALPAENCDALVLDRLQRMRPGDIVRLRASEDLHRLWGRQHARSPNTHVWVYEQAGPRDWVVRVTRRDGD